MADHQRKLSDGYTTWQQDLRTDTDLTSVTGVTLYVRAPSGSTPVTAASVNVVDEDTVSYQFSGSELTETGGHDAEFHVDHSGVTEILPVNGYFEVVVDDELGS